MLLDCANGATYRVAPEIFRRLGAEVETVADEPDGRNINDGCGSTHVESARGSAARGFDATFAFDGDGDRVLAVDRTGAVVDGDELLALAALHLRERGRLPGDGVAVTVMTNFGFHTAMREAGIEVATTPVGDRHVLAELLRRGWALGGEQSGHIIETGFVPGRRRHRRGAAHARGARAAATWPTARRWRSCPQRLINVRVQSRDARVRDRGLGGGRGGSTADGRGRVLVRPSGTEPLVRVMVEAPATSASRTRRIGATRRS